MRKILLFLLLVSFALPVYAAQTGGLTRSTASGLYVLKTGDTMTGALEGTDFVASGTIEATTSLGVATDGPITFYVSNDDYSNRYLNVSSTEVNTTVDVEIGDGDDKLGINNVNPAMGLHLGSGNSSNSLTSTNDAYVTGQLEVDGTLFSDGVLNILSQMNIFNSSTGSVFIDGNDDGVRLALGARHNQNFILTTRENRTSDHDHASASVNPTLLIHSALDPDTNNTRWGSLTHTGTAGAAGEFQITTGSGVVVVNAVSPNAALSWSAEDTFVISNSNAAGATLQIQSAAGKDGELQFSDNDRDVARIKYEHTGDTFMMERVANRGIYLDSGYGNVGLGSSEPTAKLEVVRASVASNDFLRVRNFAGTNQFLVDSTGTIVLPFGVEINRTAVTSNAYTTLVTDHIIGVNTNEAATITLGTATLTPVEPGKARICTIKDESGAAGSNNITITGEAGETIDGAVSQTISSNYGAIKVYSDGTNWFIE